MDKELLQLKDIHLPQAIHTWPIAPGWLCLYAAALMLIFYLFYAFYQRRKNRYTVNFALTKLGKLKETAANNKDNINIAAEISTLLRRTALHYFPREQIAGLSGDDWLIFLNQSGNMKQFTDESGRLLIDAPYRKDFSTDLSALFTLTQAWLMSISKKKGLSLET